MSACRCEWALIWGGEGAGRDQGTNRSLWLQVNFHWASEGVGRESGRQNALVIRCRITRSLCSGKRYLRVGWITKKTLMSRERLLMSDCTCRASFNDQLMLLKEVAGFSRGEFYVLLCSHVNLVFFIGSLILINKTTYCITWLPALQSPSDVEISSLFCLRLIKINDIFFSFVFPTNFYSIKFYNEKILVY